MSYWTFCGFMKKTRPRENFPKDNFNKPKEFFYGVLTFEIISRKSFESIKFILKKGFLDSMNLRETTYSGIEFWELKEDVLQRILFPRSVFF